MTALLSTPAVLSILLLGAHFLRDGQLALVLLLLAAIPLVVVRSTWAGRVLQLLLVLGALEWLRTLVVLARYRVALGEPWARMAVILGGVALFTALSALLLQRRRLLQRAHAE